LKVYPISMVGGIVGIVSLALPWLYIGISAPFIGSISVTGSGFEMLSLAGQLSLLTQIPGVGTAVSSSLTLMLIAAILVLIGSIVSFLHPAGGGVTLAGGAAGLAGGLWFGSIFTSLAGLTTGVTAGPGFGLFVVMAAGIMSLVGLAKPIKFAATPSVPAGPYGYPGYPPYPPYAGTPPYAAPGAYAPAPAYPPPSAATPYAASAPATPGPPLEAEPAPTPVPVEPPAPEPPVSQGTEGLLTCPTCGRTSAARFCSEDGTPTVAAAGP
jgi:hypothetical protein